MSKMSFKKRLLSSYTTLAVILLNTILIGIAVVSIGIFLERTFGKSQDSIVMVTNHLIGTDIKDGKRSYVRQYFKPQNYTEIALKDALKLIDEHEQWAASGAWQIDKWTGLLVNRKYHGSFLNVDADGRRRTISPDVTKEGLPIIHVATFGGSTTFGWGLPDWLTLTSLLQQELQTKFPDHQVRAINFGTPYYNSGLELTLYLSYLRQADYRPDIVVFLDGMNDYSHLMVSKETNMTIQFISKVYENYTKKLDKQGELPWVNVNPNFPPSRWWRKLVNVAKAQQVRKNLFTNSRTCRAG